MKRIDWDAIVSLAFLAGLAIASTTGAPVETLIFLGFASVVAALFMIKGTIERKK